MAQRERVWSQTTQPRETLLTLLQCSINTSQMFSLINRNAALSTLKRIHDHTRTDGQWLSQTWNYGMCLSTWFLQRSLLWTRRGKLFLGKCLHPRKQTSCHATHSMYVCFYLLLARLDQQGNAETRIIFPQNIQKDIGSDSGMGTLLF